MPYSYSYTPSVIYYSAAAYPTGLAGNGAMPYADPAARSGRPDPQTMPPPRPLQEDKGIYPYNGGPQNPVPMPKADPDSIRAPRQPSVPLEGRSVSVPGKKSQYTYQAYGEDRLDSKPAASDKSYLAKGQK